MPFFNDFRIGHLRGAHKLRDEVTENSNEHHHNWQRYQHPVSDRRVKHQIFRHWCSLPACACGCSISIFFVFVYVVFDLGLKGVRKESVLSFTLTHKYKRNAPFCLVDYVFASIKICPIVGWMHSQSQRRCSCGHNLLSWCTLNKEWD